jgi:hypothetical protein
MFLEGATAALVEKKGDLFAVIRDSLAPDLSGHAIHVLISIDAITSPNHLPITSTALSAGWLSGPGHNRIIGSHT